MLYRLQCTAPFQVTPHLTITTTLTTNYPRHTTPRVVVTIAPIRTTRVVTTADTTAPTTIHRQNPADMGCHTEVPGAEVASPPPPYPAAALGTTMETNNDAIATSNM